MPLLKPMNHPMRPHLVPPAPHVWSQLYADYKRLPTGTAVSFKDFLTVIGFLNAGDELPGGDQGRARAKVEPSHGVHLVDVPKKPLVGPLHVMVLLVDFPDLPGERPAQEYEDMLFSQKLFPTGSMRDYFRQVSLGKVDVTGEVHGWLRMPQTHSYYVNNRSGMGTYPRNAQGLTQHALQAARAAGASFTKKLDALNAGSVTALVIVHAGNGAEATSSVALQKRRIWSHKADLQAPLEVGTDLFATNYLTVPEDCRMGVCAHELGHLAFQWDDFYDPNYEEDGSAWAGSGTWDLMAGGSWNGGGNLPSHPAGLHKSQHGWVEVEHISKTTLGVRIPPYTPTTGKVIRVKGEDYRPSQCLILENRQQKGFDSQIPGQGLLVWRVDTDKEQVKPGSPAMLLLQADGRREMDTPNDFNDGDAGDPFPGSSRVTSLSDQGSVSTSFPGVKRSGVSLHNITIDAATNDVIVDVHVA